MDDAEVRPNVTVYVRKLGDDQRRLGFRPPKGISKSWLLDGWAYDGNQVIRDIPNNAKALRDAELDIVGTLGNFGYDVEFQ